MKLLKETIAAIPSLDEYAMEQTQLRLDGLTKPPGSLGKLEEIAVQLAGITGQAFPKVDVARVVLFAADHGVVDEGVSAFPQDVTAAMVLNFLKGGAAVNVFARQAKSQIQLIDIGMKETINHPDLIHKKVKAGTDNFCLEPAMTSEEAIQALEIGISMAHLAQNQGVHILATGEMGIGNTTASSALTAVLAQLPVEDVVGAGTGLDTQGVERKIDAIKRGIVLNQPDRNDPLGTLAKVGGLEIAGLAGLILGAASLRLPIIIDGFISSAAALVAYKLAPACKNFMLASHASAEPGHQQVLCAMDLEPMIWLNMRVGEGTGAVLMMHLVKASILVLKEMATFSEARVPGQLKMEGDHV